MSFFYYYFFVTLILFFYSRISDTVELVIQYKYLEESELH